MKSEAGGGQREAGNRHRIVLYDQHLAERITE